MLLVGRAGVGGQVVCDVVGADVGVDSEVDGAAVVGGDVVTEDAVGWIVVDDEWVGATVAAVAGDVVVDDDVNVGRAGDGVVVPADGDVDGLVVMMGAGPVVMLLVGVVPVDEVDGDEVDGLLLVVVAADVGVVDPVVPFGPEPVADVNGACVGKKTTT